VRADTTSPDTLAGVLQRVVDRTALAGWTPYDLGEWVRRRLGPTHLPVLAEVLTAQMARHPSELVAARARHGRRQGSAPVTRAARPRAGPARQGRVDRLPEEAEALSAKAQELISKHSLDALMERGAADDGVGGGPVEARRLWIDAPYVSPKCSLVHVVPVANRCSTVSSERAGFSTVVGAPHDLDAVELTTSLMVQAVAAMLAGGRQVDAWGRSRTASCHRRGPRGRQPLVPLLRAQREQVDAALRVMFPDHRAPPGHDELRTPAGRQARWPPTWPG
jgi:hypothetical protein